LFFAFWLFAEVAQPAASQSRPATASIGRAKFNKLWDGLFFMASASLVWKIDAKHFLLTSEHNLVSHGQSLFFHFIPQKKRGI
jgi:hypothetical protein